MTTQVFIDGEVGTTGLQIHQRLKDRADISLISLDAASRKDAGARRDAIHASDVTILCLPDDAALEAVSLGGGNARIIDASSAHRVSPDWTYGFAELTEGQADRIANARLVTNPGCFPTGAVALTRPLVEAGILPRDHALSYAAVSGYSGGGKAMISEMEAPGAPAFFLYGLDQAHKHLPEMKSYGLLDHTPIFTPSVGAFAQGMIVHLPLDLRTLPSGAGLADIEAALANHYAGSSHISVLPHAEASKIARLSPELHNDTNDMSLHIRGDASSGRLVLAAVLDNLGKGASGAAVQNLDLMIGSA